MLVIVSDAARLGLCQVRHTYRELVTPPLFDSPRNLSWHSPIAGAEPDWQGSSPAPANVLIMRLKGSNGRCLLMAINPYQESHTIALPPPPSVRVYRPLAA